MKTFKFITFFSFIALFMFSSCRPLVDNGLEDEDDDSSNTGFVIQASSVELLTVEVDSVYAVLTVSSPGGDIITYTEVLARAAFVNGGFELTLPSAIVESKLFHAMPDLFDESIQQEDLSFIELNPISAKVSKSVVIELYKSGEFVGNCMLSKTGEDILEYKYAAQDLTAKGSAQSDMISVEADIAFKKGWNVLATYFSLEGGISVRMLTGNAGGAKWYFSEPQQ